jgi:adenylate cyclase
MSFEIERKFLVRGEAWRAHVTHAVAIRQAYLALEAKSSIRVRIRGNESATLTIKSRGAALKRLELEYPVPVLDAERMLVLRHGAVIEKTRHLVPHGTLTWEVDVFEGDNEGLVIAEIELREEAQHVALPPWAGAEITGRPQYYNSALAQRPFSSWPAREQAAEMQA